MALRPAVTLGRFEETLDPGVGQLKLVRQVSMISNMQPNMFRRRYTRDTSHYRCMLLDLPAARGWRHRNSHRDSPSSSHDKTLDNIRYND